ncbi:MAG: hypothetical protein HZA04_10480 [Nitrospinae bacterium]|nr:hypothetical protein [Nitrospinota bacterium]
MESTAVLELKRPIKSIRLLVFRMDGTAIGFDTDQMEGMTDFGRVDVHESCLVTINELFGMGEESYNCSTPKVVFVKPLPGDGQSGVSGKRIGIVVETPEDIVDVPVENIRPLPPVVRKHAHATGFWGAALLNNGMVFIADIYKIPIYRALRGGGALVGN